jgi:superfamily I DNA/RNA helicase
MIRSLAAAIPPGGSLTFFGDVAQQIFGRRMSWRSAGLSVRKPWLFCDNYRNSRQIAKLALKIAQMPYYEGTADLVEPVAPAADGPMPAIVRCKSLSEEVNFIIGQAVEASRTQSVAILVRRREHEALFRDRLPSRSIRLHRDLPEWTSGAALYYGTFHAAKGLEFDTVILPFMSKDRMPDPEDVRTYGEDEASAGDGRLLYVGVTRARTSLIITYVGELSPLLPTEDLTVTDRILM